MTATVKFLDHEHLDYEINNVLNVTYAKNEICLVYLLEDGNHIYTNIYNANNVVITIQ